MALDAADRPGTATTAKPGAKAAQTDEATPGGIAADRLRSIVERIERLEEERKALGGDIRDIYAEAKSAGFDVKILRKVISARRLEAQERQETDELLALYMHALGM